MKVALSAVASVFIAQVANGSIPPPPPPPAAIIVYVPNTKDDLNVSCPLSYAGSKLADLESGTYVDWRVPGGLYHLSAGDAQIEIDAQPGIFTYIRCSGEDGTNGEVSFDIVETGDFGRLAGDLGSSRPALLNMFNRIR